MLQGRFSRAEPFCYTTRAVCRSTRGRGALRLQSLASPSSSTPLVQVQAPVHVCKPRCLWVKQLQVAESGRAPCVCPAGVVGLKRGLSQLNSGTENRIRFPALCTRNVSVQYGIPQAVRFIHTNSLSNRITIFRSFHMQFALFGGRHGDVNNPPNGNKSDSESSSDSEFSSDSDSESESDSADRAAYEDISSDSKDLTSVLKEATEHHAGVKDDHSTIAKHAQLHEKPGVPKDSDLSQQAVLEDLNLQELLENIQRERNEQKERLVKKSKVHRSSPMEISELVEFLQGENARDICVIQVLPEREYVSYFVTCSGMGTRHIRAMAENLAAELRGVKVGRGAKVRAEGLDSEDWTAVDMSSTVVHFFLPETRECYELEKLWTLGPTYDDQTREMKRELETMEDTVEQ